MGPAKGVTRVRSIRRLEPCKAYSPDALLVMRGVPWDMAGTASDPALQLALQGRRAARRHPVEAVPLLIGVDSDLPGGQAEDATSSQGSARAPHSEHSVSSRGSLAQHREHSVASQGSFSSVGGELAPPAPLVNGSDLELAILN